MGAKLRVMVDNRVRVEGELSPGALEHLAGLFTYANPDYHKQRRMGFYVGKMSPTIVTHRVEGGAPTFPRGAFRKVREALRSYGHEFDIIDNRVEGRTCSAREIPDTNVTLYPYQEPVVRTLIEKQNCVMRMPTGSGKSTIALAMASRLKVPTLVIVWSTNLYDQWHTRIVKELGLSPNEIGHVRGGNVQLKPITLAMQQTFNSKGVGKNVQKYFGLVIADELQKFASNTFQSTIDQLPSKYRIGVSADERRRDRKEFLIYDHFGQVAGEIERDVLIDSGHVLDVEVIVAPTTFRTDWYKEVQEFTLLLERMCVDDERNQLIVDLAMKEIRKGEQVLVMSHRREHCVELAKMLASQGVRSGLMLGGDDYSNEFALTRRRLESGELKVAVGTIQAIGQGLDLPKVGVAVVATPTASNKQQFGQIRGRVCRVAQGKTSARLYYLWDREVYGTFHLRNLESWNNIVRVMKTPDEEPIEVGEYMRSRRVISEPVTL